MHSNFNDLKTKTMTPREFRQEQEFEFDHFIELTRTGIKPNYANIELFAHEYHKRKLKLLGIGDVVGRSEQLKAVEKLKDFAYEVCPLHREDDLEQIVGSL